MKYKVRFTVQFETEVECDSTELVDEVCDLYIPEDDQTTYVTDTFQVNSITDENGQNIELKN